MDAPVTPLPRFNPRKVPVVGVDAQLPAVPAERLAVPALRRRFAAPPPWEPEVRREPLFSYREECPAAVLIPLVQHREGLSVLLTQRTDDLPTHAGQVAFPGGKVERQDPSVRATALREASEEIGLAPRQTEVIGQMPLYVTGSCFAITPVVALVERDFVPHPNAGEVAAVFEVPLAFLMDPAHHHRHRLKWQGHTREWLSMPYLDSAPDGETVERFIWGATAGMIRNLYRFLIA